MSIRNRIGMKMMGKSFDSIVKQSVRAELQEFVVKDGNVVSYDSGIRSAYVGNEYTTYGEAVIAINSKYNALSDWGVVLTGSIVDVRAAFTVPAGLEIIETEEGDFTKEMAFAEAFMKYNGLDNEMPFEFAKESEIEGKLCLQLFDDKAYKWKNGNTGMIKARFLPWTTTKYNIITKNDYMNFLEVSYKDGSGNKQAIKQKDFVYRRFGGRIDRPNEPAMKIWKCLSKIDDLDKSLRDWREINRLFAGPTPHFQCETTVQAKELTAILNQMNWKIKKLLVTTAKFEMVGPNMAGVDAIEKEIVTLAKMISGTTGVPVHFLGLPDLLSNRATANNLMELVWASTVKERETWNSAYTELLRKAIDKYNLMPDNKGFTELRNDVLRVEVQEVTPETWVHLEKVYLPMLMAGDLSLEFVLSKIPGLNLQEEMARQEEMKKDELQKTKDALNKVILDKGNDDKDKDEDGENGNNNNE